MLCVNYANKKTRPAPVPSVPDPSTLSDSAGIACRTGDLTPSGCSSKINSPVCSDTTCISRLLGSGSLRVTRCGLYAIVTSTAFWPRRLWVIFIIRAPPIIARQIEWPTSWNAFALTSSFSALKIFLRRIWPYEFIFCCHAYWALLSDIESFQSVNSLKYDRNSLLIAST